MQAASSEQNSSGAAINLTWVIIIVVGVTAQSLVDKDSERLIPIKTTCKVLAAVLKIWWLLLPLTHRVHYDGGHSE